tara:strand:- start:246 stop:386 length:141 start_codon:yes stop_codon:yes gene_type:complete
MKKQKFLVREIPEQVLTKFKLSCVKNNISMNNKFLEFLSKETNIPL